MNISLWLLCLVLVSMFLAGLLFGRISIIASLAADADELIKKLDAALLAADAAQATRIKTDANLYREGFLAGCAKSRDKDKN